MGNLKRREYKLNKDDNIHKTQGSKIRRKDK